MKRAAPALRVMALAIEVAAAAGGIRAPVGKVVDAVLGNAQTDYFSGFLKVLNDIAPDATADSLVQSQDTAAIEKYIEDNKASRREAFLAIRDVLGDRNVLKTCGLVKEITGDGRIVWIRKHEVIVKAFRDGKPPDEAKALMDVWESRQAADALASKETKKESWFGRSTSRSFVIIYYTIIVNVIKLSIQ